MSTPSPESGKTSAHITNSLRAFALAAKGIRWPYALIAFCLAVTLWYTVTVRDKVESWVDVQVQFRDAPSNLVITEGLINKVSVRVRAARGLSRSLVGREAAMVVSLASITRGSNAIAIQRDMLPFTSAYEVVEVSPSRILIVADTKASRQIPLESAFEGKLASDLFVKSMQLEPHDVTVSGAETLVSGISRIRIPIHLEPDMRHGMNSLSVAVPAPANVEVTPPQVEIRLDIGVRTKEVKVVCQVVPAGPKGDRAPSFVPGKVTVVAKVPESLAKNQEVLGGITASVTVPADIGEDARKLPVTVALPKNSDLVSVTPAEVAVSVPVAEE